MFAVIKSRGKKKYLCKLQAVCILTLACIEVKCCCNCLQDRTFSPGKVNRGGGHIGGGSAYQPPGGAVARGVYQTGGGGAAGQPQPQSATAAVSQVNQASSGREASYREQNLAPLPSANTMQSYQ